MSEEVRQSWEYQPSDTKDSFAAFTLYRDLLQERSTVKVGQKLGKSTELIQRWSREKNWQQRAADYDAYLDSQYRAMAEKEHIEALKDFRMRMLTNAGETSKASARLLQRALERMEDEDDKTPGTIASMARAAAALAEIALQQEGTALGVDDLLRRLAVE